MALDDIPVRAEDGDLSGSAPAVLREIASLLELLVRTGDGGSIDLSSLPLTQADRRWLLGRLGKGEVEISLAIGGRSRIVETGYPGVWWVEHHNEQDALTGEFIEVSYAPELVYAHPDDAENGLESLKTLLSELS